MASPMTVLPSPCRACTCDGAWHDRAMRLCSSAPKTALDVYLKLDRVQTLVRRAMIKPLEAAEAFCNPGGQGHGLCSRPAGGPTQPWRDPSRPGTRRAAWRPDVRKTSNTPSRSGLAGVAFRLGRSAPARDRGRNEQQTSASRHVWLFLPDGAGGAANPAGSRATRGL